MHTVIRIHGHVLQTQRLKILPRLNLSQVRTRILPRRRTTRLIQSAHRAGNRVRLSVRHILQMLSLQIRARNRHRHRTDEQKQRQHAHNQRGNTALFRARGDRVSGEAA